MLDRFSSLMRGCLIAMFAVGALAWPASSRAGEPIQFSNQKEKPDATQEKKNILKYRAYRPSDSINNPSIVAPPVAVPANPTPSNPATTRRQQELLDRDRNWIFLSPHDDKPQTAEEVLGVSEMTSDQKPKSVVNRFLEQRSNNEKDTSADPLGRYSWEREANSSNPPAFPGFNNEKQGRPGLFNQSDSLERSIGTRNTTPSLEEIFRERTGPRAEKLREEKMMRMSEYESLFAPQTSFGGLNPFSSGGGTFGLQPATPQGINSGLSRPAPEASKFTDQGRAPARPLSGIGGAPALPDANSRVFGSSPAQSLLPEPTRVTPQPSVLPVPHRRL